MQQPSSSVRRAPDPPPAPTPTSTEIVTRPEPGIARGKWEAPSWAFWTILALVVVGSAVYLLFRLGVLRGKKAKEADIPPVSRGRRP